MILFIQKVLISFTFVGILVFLEIVALALIGTIFISIFKFNPADIISSLFYKGMNNPEDNSADVQAQAKRLDEIEKKLNEKK